MKCSQCYADNPPWATVCHACGLSVCRLELCPAGHLLPPGAGDCPVCPDLWPETASFSGPAILRGLLWVEGGRLVADAEPGNDVSDSNDVPYLEIRDADLPLAIAASPSGVARIVPLDAPAATCRILMRPEGLSVCDRQVRRRSGPPAYGPLRAGDALTLGTVRLRFQALSPPAWVEKAATESKHPA